MTDKARLPTLFRQILTQSWRPSPPPLQCSAELLNEAEMPLLSVGAGALGWWRVRESGLRETAPAQRLREVHMRQVVQNALQEAEITKLFTHLRERGIEPILVKGWALARLYPELGLRPYGDIDLLLRPEDDRPAFDSVAGWERAHYTFDIQYQDYPKLADRTLDDLFRRSQLVPLQDTEIRVLSHEDHLALTCLHFLRHGGFRPLWLCDIAMYVESLPAGFDWQLCLGSDPVVAGWLESAIALAHVILGARIDGTPAMARVPRLPSWLVPALLKAWRRPFPYQHPETHEPIRAVLRHPSRLAEAVRARWWDPIRASIWAGAPLDSSPRLPLQVQNAVWQLRNYGAEFRPPPRAGGTGARSAP